MRAVREPCGSSGAGTKRERRGASRQAWPPTMVPMGRPPIASACARAAAPPAAAGRRDAAGQREVKKTRAPASFVELPRIEVSGGDVDVLKQVASIKEVKVLDARLQARRDADGKLP